MMLGDITVPCPVCGRAVRFGIRFGEPIEGPNGVTVAVHADGPTPPHHCPAREDLAMAA